MVATETPACSASQRIVTDFGLSFILSRRRQTLGVDKSNQTGECYVTGYILQTVYEAIANGRLFEAGRAAIPAGQSRFD